MLRRWLPNALRLARVPLAVLTAAAVLAGDLVVAALLFGTAAMSDLVDGVLARRWRVTSNLGGVIDHGCDALYVTLTLAAFAALGNITWCLPPLIALAFAQYMLDSGAQHGRRLRASQLGRWNGIGYFVLAGVAIGVALLWPSLQPWVAALGWLLVVSTVASMTDRLLAARRPTG